MVGKYSLALAITAPIFMFTGLQLRTVQIADVGNKFDFNTYFCLRIWSSLLGILITLGILLLCNYTWEVRVTIFLIGVAKALESLSDILWGLQQKSEQMDSIAKSMFLRGVLSVVGFISAIYISGTVATGALALSFSAGLVLFFYDIPKTEAIDKEAMRTKLNEQFRKKHQDKAIIKLIRIAIPLGVVLALISLNGNIPRYFVEYYLGEGSLGVFSALVYFMIPGNLIMNSMGQTMSTQMAKMVYEKNIAMYRHHLKKIIAVGGMISVVALFFSVIWGREILLIFYSGEFTQQARILIWVMGISFFIYVSAGLGYGMTAAGYFKSQIPLFIGVTIVTILCNYILVPAMGIFGAVLSLFISGFTQFLGSVWILRNIIWMRR